MSSSESSASDSPPPSSPEASTQQGPPSLERIVVHFVAAKRSLASTSHLWRANEIVTRSRALIEEIAVLNARNAFARHGVDDQLDLLHAIRDGVAESSDVAGDEFQVIVASLDAANDRLQVTLKKLRQTVVDSALHGDSAPAEDSGDIDDGRPELETARDDQPGRRTNKTLYDFIDENTHTDLLDSLHALIDSYKDAKDTLNAGLGTFDNTLRTIADTLQEDTISSSGAQTKRTLYDSLTPAATITQLFRGMEEHAAEMATLLQNLVSHYDLCVTALKHTDGGGAAAKRAMQQAGATLMKPVPGAEEESLYQKTVPEPMSDDERIEMLRVLEGDASQVEDVSSEIQDHSDGMEAQHEQLSRHALKARANHKALRTVLDQLHSIKTALPAHIHASRDFHDTWRSIQSSIADRTEDLAGLHITFDEFLSSYASLLREVDRRKAAEGQMRRLAAQAQKELNKLFAADGAAREEFTREVGVSLPGDIWPGAREAGVSLATDATRHREVNGYPELLALLNLWRPGLMNTENERVVRSPGCQAGQPSGQDGTGSSTSASARHSTEPGHLVGEFSAASRWTATGLSQARAGNLEPRSADVNGFPWKYQANL
ncbi:autophagy protein 17 [Friedmanniomyces endolithicus]|nr:autophagy protein 17 [Friedmanniomyces endolithicus]